jgi:hypothetical protein
MHSLQRDRGLPCRGNSPPGPGIVTRRGKLVKTYLAAAYRWINLLSFPPPRPYDYNKWVRTRPMRNLSDVWQEVGAWPPDLRRELATRIIQSLRRDQSPIASQEERAEALRKLIGIWKTPSPPSDDDVEQIIREQKQRKYH